MRTLVRRPRVRLLSAMGAAVVVATVLSAPASGAPNDYVLMSDGTSIAINVRMPKAYEPGRRYPTIFEMSGYDGGSSNGTTPGGVLGEGSRGLTRMFEDDYVTVHASVRGSGCSAGEFDLFSWRSALDGREVIEWIARQEWSNGDVGIYGHSYGGMTGFMVAATKPPPLRAVSVSGLIDDLYRGVTYPGGVVNYGFPLLWTGVIRPVYDVGGGTFPGIAAGDVQCAQNLLTHSRDPFEDPLVRGLDDQDNNWWRSRSLITYAERIDVPIHITGAYQDEQTGPRGPYHLFEAVDHSRARRLLMTNGHHGTQTDPPSVHRDRKAWMDHWLLSRGSRPRRSSVTALLEMGEDNRPNGRLEASDFPLEAARWRDLFLHPGQKLRYATPGPEGGSDDYLFGGPRQSWSFQAGDEVGPPVTTFEGPDELTYKSPRFRRAAAIAGPMTATLYASSTAPDTELFVQLIDEAPDGTRYYLQRGMLRASHRAVNRSLSDKLVDGTIYRPYRPHTNPSAIEPERTYRYLVEVFPVGHVFRPGHRLVMKVHTPPAIDSYYVYVPKRIPAINTVHHDAIHPSRLMVPFVPVKGARLGPAPAPCSLQGVRCVPSS